MYEFVDEFSEKIKSEISKIIEDLTKERDELVKDKESLEGQIIELGGEVESHKQEKEAALQEAEIVKIQLSQTKTVRQSLDSYRQSVNIITEWVPSQRESIEVLIACSEIENITLDDLANHTKIGPMILKRNILPRLETSGFISIQKLENDLEVVNLAKTINLD